MNEAPDQAAASVTGHAAPATPNVDDVMGILRGVIDPELGSDIVELGMAKGARVDADGTVHVTIALTTSGCPLRAEIQRDVRARVGSLPGVTKVRLDWTELDQAGKAAAMERARRNIAERPERTSVPTTAKVVMVASGKGGVGKSSVTVNLAAALANKGFTVGVIDADIWGFSVPRMVGLEGRLAAEEQPASTATAPGATGSSATAADATDSSPPADPSAERRPRIIPNEITIGAGRLKVVSMGFLVDDEGSALMWRGLVLNRAVQHFLEDVDWDGVDYLLIDMPPGTGDVQMGLAKLLPRAEMLVVTTPSLTAQKVAVRVVDMGRKNFLHIAGVIENMSSYVDDTGREHLLFGSGGGERLAAEAGVPLLARIPIEPAVADGGDHGRPIALGEGPAAEAFRGLADELVDDIIPPADLSGCSTRLMGAVQAALAAADATT
ncbi:MAG TPA: Mrp/NBP35 family ATP-binding protein [Microthrixaceae bacterium]|nr:Mrp/NBP35 family ATP-binding protein [Microthrixaceae bacterium]